MRTKNFHTYLKKRLDKEEIAKIEEQAQLEKLVFQKLQNDISKIVTDYMAEESIGFNELVRRLDVSPTQISKIQRCEANLTISSLAHIFALLGKKPHLTISAH